MRGREWKICWLTLLFGLVNCWTCNFLYVLTNSKRDSKSSINTLARDTTGSRGSGLEEESEWMPQWCSAYSFENYQCQVEAVLSFEQVEEVEVEWGMLHRAGICRVNKHCLPQYQEGVAWPHHIEAYLSSECCSTMKRKCEGKLLKKSRWSGLTSSLLQHCMCSAHLMWWSR